MLRPGSSFKADTPWKSLPPGRRPLRAVGLRLVKPTARKALRAGSLRAGGQSALYCTRQDYTLRNKDLEPIINLEAVTFNNKNTTNLVWYCQEVSNHRVAPSGHTTDQHGKVVTKALMGHQRLATTEIYTHLSPQIVKIAYNCFKSAWHLTRHGPSHSSYKFSINKTIARC